MNRIGIVGLAAIFMIACVEKKQNETARNEKSLLEEILITLNGEFDNFQQCWQENTKEGIHQVATSSPHLHIHSRFQRIEVEETNDPVFQIKHTAGKDSTILLSLEYLRFWQASKSDTVYSQQYYSNSKGLSSFSENEMGNLYVWEKEGDAILGRNEMGETVYRLSGDTLAILDSKGIFSATENTAYRMKKCRFFSGWIEYPLPENTDSTYRMTNLKMHDQGGIIPLALADGTRTNYSVELTQLVYGKRIELMKLAIYDEPFDSINYNSRAISYTWTSPEATRIGINLRKIVSGWTLIEPGYINSNTMKKEKIRKD